MTLILVSCRQSPLNSKRPEIKITNSVDSIKIGESYTTRILVENYSNDFAPEFFFCIYKADYVNGNPIYSIVNSVDTLEVIDRQGYFEKNVINIGSYEYGGLVKLKDSTNKEYFMPFKFGFEAVE